MNRICSLSAICLLLVGACKVDRPKESEPPGDAAQPSQVEGVAAPSAAAPVEPATPLLPRFQDFNRNGIDDALDIAYMNSLDENNNGIPDEAE